MRSASILALNYHHTVQHYGLLACHTFEHDLHRPITCTLCCYGLGPQRIVTFAPNPYSHNHQFYPITANVWIPLHV